mmetsp:Transcript_5644/g.6661  ORF Transcript_5644/g.6661 Transcript_5644/m.6661 type:complete len:198 (-) Transcript_5644:574-1167(-)
MERKDETIKTITDLIQSVSSQINNSSNHIATLEGLTNKLVPNEIREVAVQDKQNVKRELSVEEEEEYIIRMLEQQRLERVIDLQNHEYMNEKLMELIDLNEDIMQSVKDYLEKREKTREEERKYADSRIKHFTDDMVEPTIEVLETNLIQLNNGIEQVENTLNGFVEYLQNDDQKMLPEYQEKINALIQVINKAFNI